MDTRLQLKLFSQQIWLNVLVELISQDNTPRFEKVIGFAVGGPTGR